MDFRSVIQRRRFSNVKVRRERRTGTIWQSGNSAVTINLAEMAMVTIEFSDDTSKCSGDSPMNSVSKTIALPAANSKAALPAEPSTRHQRILSWRTSGRR